MCIRDRDCDADVLSNTSSEESAQLNRIYDFRTTDGFSNVGANIGQTGDSTVSESFDTLSNSNVGGTVLPSLEGSKLKDSAIRETELQLCDIIDISESKPTKLKMWHVIILSSLLSMTFSYLALEYSLTGDLLGGFKSQRMLRNNERKLLYDNINFVDKISYDSTSDSLSQWAPSGKYYVDFDNHIAYPLKDDDLVGWKRYKTDIVIFWYTTKARMKDGWYKRVNKLKRVNTTLQAFLKNAFRSTQETMMIMYKELDFRWQRLSTPFHNKYMQFSPHLRRVFGLSCREMKHFRSWVRLQTHKFNFNLIKPFRISQFKVRKDANWLLRRLKWSGLKFQHSRIYRAISECKKNRYFKCRH